jgi:hypothetical protein
MGTRSPDVDPIEVWNRPGIAVEHFGQRPSTSVAFATAKPRRRITQSPQEWQYVSSKG